MSEDKSDMKLIDIYKRQAEAARASIAEWPVFLRPHPAPGHRRGTRGYKRVFERGRFH